MRAFSQKNANSHNFAYTLNSSQIFCSAFPDPTPHHRSDCKP